jgi:hypothetical protein
MGDASTEVPLVATCPNCGKSYAAPAEQAGLSAQCRNCRQTFAIEPRPKNAATAQTEARSGGTKDNETVGAAVTTGLLCPICQSPTGTQEETVQCPTCQTVHHRECWDYNKGCGLYGCQEAPATEKLEEIEIPASYWGQTEKACPRCRKMIQAAAIRCRHCGLTFETARPQETSEFAAKQMQAVATKNHQRFGTVLLALAIIPCLSPFVAIVGILWYVLARRHISVMTPLHATICRLAVVIASAVTLLFVAAAAAYSTFH